MDRKLKDFQRLVSRTESLNDIESIKENMGEIDKQFNELRNTNALTVTQSNEYYNRISKIQRKLAPGITSNVRKARTMEVRHKDIDFDKERQKHDQIAQEILGYTSKIKDNVIKLGVISAEDSEVLSNVHKNVEHANDKSTKTNEEMRVTKNERIGWRAYIWLIKIVVVFFLVRFIFQ